MAFTTITISYGSITVTATYDGNTPIKYQVVLPSGRTVTVPDLFLLGSLILRDGEEGALLYDGRRVVETEDQGDIQAIVDLANGKAEIIAKLQEEKNLADSGTPQTVDDPDAPDTPEEDEEEVENPEPEDVLPEELDGLGYTIPEEETVENPDPEEVTPEELRGEGYAVPGDDELTLLRPPEYEEAPEVTPEELTGAGYDIPEEPEGALLLTPEGAAGGGGSRGLVGGRAAARSAAFIQDQYKTNSLKDWRVRLTLAANSKYLYNADTPGILAPLKATNGVVFPYTPQVQTTYAANYEATSPTHSNFKIFQYGTSSVDQVSITCDFTAQDTFEANYLLAVIHFFRSVTKMFYGQDQDPRAGTPPPLVFLEGMGAFQYNKHPLVINNFSYNLPNDVDYIRAYLTSTATGQTGSGRLGSTIAPGGIVPKTVFNYNAGNSPPTYVPTRIQIQVSAYPIITRNRISNEFSLKKYGTGELVNKGIW